MWLKRPQQGRVTHQAGHSLLRDLWAKAHPRPLGPLASPMGRPPSLRLHTQLSPVPYLGHHTHHILSATSYRHPSSPMDLIFEPAMILLVPNPGMRDGVQCHRPKHWTWSQKAQLLLPAPLLSNSENLG